MVAAPRKAAESGRRTASMSAGDIHCAIGLHTNNTFLSKALRQQTRDCPDQRGMTRRQKKNGPISIGEGEGSTLILYLRVASAKKVGCGSASSVQPRHHILNSKLMTAWETLICGAVYVGQYTPHAAVVRHWQYSLDAIYPCLSFPHTGQIPLLIPIFLLPVI